MAASAGAQTISYYGVSKRLDYIQSSAATPVLSQILSDPIGPYNFGISVSGSNLSTLSPAPSVKLPGGTVYPLAYDTTQNKWDFISGPSHNFTTQAALDGAFPDGSYTMTVDGTSVPLNLSPDSYPVTPMVTTGVWDGAGNLRFDPTADYTINLNGFPAYSNGGYMYLEISTITIDSHGVSQVGSTLVDVIAISTEDNPVLSSYNIAANTLQPNTEYYATVAYAQFKDLNATAIPSTVGGIAYFEKDTGFYIYTAPLATANATHFAVSAPGSATAGSSINVAVTALDASNNTAAGYAGTVKISSSDGSAGLPANSKLTNGTGTFSVTLNAAGPQTVTATDTLSQAITGTSGTITVGSSGPGSAPSIVTQPAAQTANSGASVTFWVLASGSSPVSYQWNFNGTAIPSATSALLVISNAMASSAGSYTVTVSNPLGSATSNPATLTMNSGSTVSPPAIALQPESQTMASGSTVVFSALANGSGSTAASVSSRRADAGPSGATASYQWFMNGNAISGATSSALVIGSATSANDGVYTCLVTNSGGSIVTNGATLNVVNTTNPGRLINISCRAGVGTGSNILIAGFVVGGAGTAGPESLLVRGSGPALVPFGVSGTLADPELQLYSGPTLLASNAGWAGAAQIASSAASVGAFAWGDPSSHDSALAETLAGGAYTAQVAGQSGDTGVALAEVYDATQAGTYAPTTPRIINISARVQVGTGANVLIAGFVVSGSTWRTVLIRASGPALVPFGVSGTLADPELQLYLGSTLIASNTGWGGNAQIASSAASVGAFAWSNPSSSDSAILVTLPPGAYTAQVSGASGDTGIALVEVYEVP